MRLYGITLVTGLFLLCMQQQLQAQPFMIDWHTLDGGGGTSLGGVFVMTGTIGQADAGPSQGVMAGGLYEMLGGFWAMVASVPASPGDCDGSGFIDLPDLFTLVDCLSGPALKYDDGCDCADIDGDNAITMLDVAVFQLMFSPE